MSRERALLARLAPLLGTAGEDVALGSGDDAAVVSVDGTAVAMAVDVLVEGVHWRPDVSALADVGWKALAVNVSDLAAVGADPVAAVVGLQLPAGVVDEDVEALYAGLAEAAARWTVQLVGGDLVDAERLSLSVTVIGALRGREPVTRAGARPGHALVCAGALGASAATLAQLGAGVPPDPRLLSWHRRPAAFPAAGRALAEVGATAMIDVSDGVGVDVAHLCRASGVAARLSAAQLPVADGVAEAARETGTDQWDLVVGGGEDFALLAAVPAERADTAVAAAAAAGAVPAAVVGTVVEPDAGGPLVGLDMADGCWRDITDQGFEHGD